MFTYSISSTEFWFWFSIGMYVNSIIVHTIFFISLKKQALDVDLAGPDIFLIKFYLLQMQTCLKVDCLEQAAIHFSAFCSGFSRQRELNSNPKIRYTQKFFSLCFYIYYDHSTLIFLFFRFSCGLKIFFLQRFFATQLKSKNPSHPGILLTVFLYLSW